MMVSSATQTDEQEESTKKTNYDGPADGDSLSCDL